LRPNYASDKAKNWNKRIEAPTRLFKKDDPTYPLHTFEEDLLEHLEDCGMETIFYVPAITITAEMANVIRNKDRFTLLHVQDEQKSVCAKFDEYDRENDRAAKKYLESSLDPTLKAELRVRQEAGDTAAITWMRIISLVCDGSIERFNRKREELKQLSPLKEPGENIMLYADKARRVCNELFQAGQFEPVLCLALVKALCMVTVEAFRAVFMPMRVVLDDTLVATSFLSREAALAHLLSKDLHYTRILTRAEDRYKSLLDNGEWTPAKNVKDSSGAPSFNLSQITQVSFNKLVQNAIEKTLNNAKDVTCFSCGKKGHYSKDCRSKPPPSTGGSTHPSPASSKSDSGNKKDNAATDDDKKKISWKLTPPGPNEPRTKQNGTGRTFHWCSKCGRKGYWNPNHEEKDHVRRPDQKPTTTVSSHLAMTEPGESDSGHGVLPFW
jgi:hypothetical protein